MKEFQSMVKQSMDLEILMLNPEVQQYPPTHQMHDELDLSIKLRKSKKAEANVVISICSNFMIPRPKSQYSQCRPLHYHRTD